MRNPVVIRGVKLSIVAACISSLCAVVGTFLLEGYRWFLWSFGFSLLALMLHWIWNAYRRGTDPVKPGSSGKQSRQVTILTVLAIALGLMMTLVDQFIADNAESLLGGLALGALGALGLIFSPLFFVPTDADNRSD